MAYTERQLKVSEFVQSAQRSTRLANVSNTEINTRIAALDEECTQRERARACRIGRNAIYNKTHEVFELEWQIKELKSKNKNAIELIDMKARAKQLLKDVKDINDREAELHLIESFCTYRVSDLQLARAIQKYYACLMKRKDDGVAAAQEEPVVMAKSAKKLT